MEELMQVQAGTIMYSLEVDDDEYIQDPAVAAIWADENIEELAVVGWKVSGGLAYKPIVFSRGLSESPKEYVIEIGSRLFDIEGGTFCLDGLSPREYAVNLLAQKVILESNTVGQESLEDVMYDISPVDSPFLSGRKMVDLGAGESAA